MQQPPPLPSPGDVVRVRQRTWLVNQVQPGADSYQSGLVQLACLDDDAAGEQLRVLWSHELDAATVPSQPQLVRPGARLDPPRLFGAYLNAMRWNTVTSTDRRLLQAPFRAGIDLKPYQLEPLRKALELPRVNLFIADDVGLGKTIEAGLVVQELVLRQRVDRILIVCPPSVSLQWQEEMEQRFGLPFAIYDRDFVSARRRERGFGVNPWTTHNRFIVSYAMLRGTRSTKGRGTQHLELLLSALGDKAPRSLLILDECHQVAPASGSLYPIDSRTTRAVRQVAERMEHRLFLSATPHNGHSHSFASLLHLLDPQRFTRGVPIQSAAELAPVMVRRLKRHLRQHVDGLPERVLVDHPVHLEPTSPEVELGHMLAEYDALYRACLSDLPKRQQLARSLVVVNLHKRLLSSITAFHHTLQLHARGADRALGDVRQQAIPLLPVRGASGPDDDLDEEALDAHEDAFAEATGFDMGSQARELLARMLALSTQHRARPDGRVRALAAWINEHMCPGGRFGPRRLVVFTEYEHTLSWLRRALPPLLLDQAPQAIDRFTGRLSDDNREQLKAAFNSAPEKHPLRILLATDAAREGINLQAHCADLFHFDLPWNPSRIEQRNGRIDRVLQPEPQVRCHYFVLPERPEDRVLTYLVRKLHVIREELGSLSEVISARLEARMEQGIRDLRVEEVDALSRPDAAALAAQQELEGQGAELLHGDLAVLGRQLERSQRRLDYRWEHLQELVDLGLHTISGQGLDGPRPGDPPTWALPPLDASWAGITDAMREQQVVQDRRAPPPPIRPVAFQAAHRLDAPAVQLHLGHPLVRRLVARFRAQGVARHDLSRVTLIASPQGQGPRVIAFGRLSLFGRGATRLHEELISVSAQVHPTDLAIFGEAGLATSLERLNEALASHPAPHPSRGAQAGVLGRCARDFEALWPSLEQQGRQATEKAALALQERGEREAADMEALLTRQRARIGEQFEASRQLSLDLLRGAAEERENFERDRRFMDARLDAIEREIIEEPRTIRASYEVVLRRFEPVGLAYLWPVGTA
ncbi:MAG: DISARM system SNF2-like helicase DrmD [Pseudomonadota bacterium]